MLAGSMQCMHSLDTLGAPGRCHYPIPTQPYPTLLAGLAVLGALISLRELSVASTAAGDASLAAWGGLTALTRLNLDSTAVTNRRACCTPQRWWRCKAGV